MVVDVVDVGVRELSPADAVTAVTETGNVTRKSSVGKTFTPATRVVALPTGATADLLPEVSSM